MPITITPTTTPDVDRDVNFSISISATGSPEVIESVTVTASTADSGVTITNGTTSSTISGAYTDLFTDSITYITKGSSDLIETPTTVIGTGNVPEGKTVINLVNDRTARKTITYNISVVSDTGTNSFTLDQDITNDGEAAANWLTSYIERNT